MCRDCAKPMAVRLVSGGVLKAKGSGDASCLGILALAIQTLRANRLSSTIWKIPQAGVDNHETVQADQYLESEWEKISSLLPLL